MDGNCSLHIPYTQRTKGVLMHKPDPVFLNAFTTKQPESISCLTINQSGSTLGLSNLLDLINHEICQEENQQIHRLTFKSGETLCIKADPRTITVRGSRINFYSDSNFPHATLLGDPAKKTRYIA